MSAREGSDEGRLRAGVAVIAATLSAVLVLGIVATVGHAATGRVGAAACSHLQIAVSPVSGAGGAGGSEAVMYGVRHLFELPCVLDGFPRVELLSSRFQSRRAVLHDGGGYLNLPGRPRRVTLAAGRPAYFVMAFSDNQGPGRERCAPDRYVLVALPGERVPVVAYAVRKSGFPRGQNFVLPCGPSLWVTSVLRRRP